VRLIRSGPGSIAGIADLLAEVGARRALLVTTRRGAEAAARLPLPLAGAFEGVRPHVPVETVELACAQVVELDADALIGFGGGAAIDTCKAVAARLLAEGPATGRCKIVAVPTTYAGAEWTPFFGMLLGPGRKGGGMDERVTPVAAVYDAELTLGLPLEPTVGTTMNALAHCAEAYYHPSTNEDVARNADAGTRAIAAALPEVAADLGALPARTLLLEGAMHAALALADSGLCLGHAMAQGLGGRYGLPQGTMNAICLPVALRFNAVAAPAALTRFADALGVDDAPKGCHELARLGGFPLRLRDHGVPLAELDEVAAQIAARPGARANPRPVAAADVEGLLREIW
jgi:maleylacetate reductase